MGRKMISITSLNRILQRQRDFEWGDEYVPGILASPREAPKRSRVSRLNSGKLNRTLNLLSTPERVFTQLALYHPRLLELHEQKMLFPWPHVHPLHGHPLAKGMQLPGVAGTVAIAGQIGMQHAKVPGEDENGEPCWFPYPYLGDLLLYLTDDEGRPFAINWTIKLSKEDFNERNRRALKSLEKVRKDREHAALRNLLEENYYLSAGIRTVKLSLDLVDFNVASNLDLLFGSSDIGLNLDDNLLEDFSQDLLAAAQAGTPPAYVAIEYGKQWGRRDLFLTKIYQDIWDRKLKVDLHKPILVDHPLELGGVDIADLYGSFFERSAP